MCACHPQLLTDPPPLLRHSGPVWQVAWAHPSFGPILASCSYDGRVYVWKEVAGQPQGGANRRGPAQAQGPAEWEKIKEHSLHGASGESGQEMGGLMQTRPADSGVAAP